jgi:hypothetical protein
MKRIYLAFVGFMMSLAFVWAQNCTQPMANFSFQQQKNNINNQPNESQRLMLAKQLLDGNCLASSQIKEICELLSNDFNKLDFAKSAYNRTTDRANFYEVYNAFSYFSTVFILHDYVVEQRGGGNTTPVNPVNPVNPTTSVTFPNLNYPSHMGYNGARKCDFPLADNAFMPLATDIRNQANDTDRMNKLDQYTNSYCMTTGQIMRFATLLTEDSNRLNFLKKAYARVFDLTNYNQAGQVLQFVQSQNNFMTFLNSNSSVSTPTCVVTVADMTDMKTRVQKEAFDNTKVNTAKTIARVKKCFTCAQVKDIVTWFTYSDSKMNIAQFMWDFTTDRENFYIVADSFTFSSDKDKLMKFIESKK